MFWVFGIVWISASREICKKHLTLEFPVSHNFPALSKITFLMFWEQCYWCEDQWKVFISDAISTQAFIGNSLLFCSWTRPSISIVGPFAIEVWKYIQYRRVGSTFYGSSSNCNIPMNITIGIRLKIDPSGLQQKCFSWDFPQLLDTRHFFPHY